MPHLPVRPQRRDRPVWSHAVSLGFEDLFTPASAGWRALVNYGLAALAWLGLGALASTLIYRFVEPRRDEPTTG